MQDDPEILPSFLDANFAQTLNIFNKKKSLSRKKRTVTVTVTSIVTSIADSESVPIDIKPTSLCQSETGLDCLGTYHNQQKAIKVVLYLKPSYF